MVTFSRVHFCCVIITGLHCAPFRKDQILAIALRINISGAKSKGYSEGGLIQREFIPSGATAACTSLCNVSSSRRLSVRGDHGVSLGGQDMTRFIAL